MTKFPLHKLPMTVWKWLSRDLGFPDLLSLSLCSKQFQQIIGCTKLKLAYFHIDNSIEDRYALRYSSTQSNKALLIIDHISELPDYRADFTTLRIAGSEVLLKTEVPSMVQGLHLATMYVFTDDPKYIAELFLDYTFSTMVSSIQSVSFINIDRYFTEKMLSFDMVLNVTSVEFCDMEQDSVHLTVTRMHHLNKVAFEGTPNHEILDVQTIDMNGNLRIRREELLNLNCEDAFLGAVYVDQNDLNEYLHRWANGTNGRLRSLTVGSSNTVLNIQTILDGLEVEKWDESKREPCFSIENGRGNVNCSNGYDIERSDGLLATALVQSKFFYFVVWHDRFPNRKNS